MTTYEFISTHCGVLEQMVHLSVNPTDVKYLELYREYTRLMSEGHKKTYIMQYLSDEYSVDERTIYRIVRRFQSEIKI